MFLVNRNGDVLDIVEVARYAERGAARGAVRRRATGRTRSRPPATRNCASCSARRTRSRCSPRACRPSASATRAGTCSICRRSTRCGRRRSATRALAERLFQTAFDLADSREGALFVVLRDPATVAAAARRAGRSTRCGRGTPAGRVPTRGQLHAHAARPKCLRARSRRARRSRADGWRHGDGSRPAGCWPSARFSCTPNRPSRTRISRSRGRERPRRWRPAVSARS